MIAYETRFGRIDISEQYLSKLIGNEVTNCFGVVGMVPSGGKQRIFSKLRRNASADTGIRVSGDANGISVELHIVVTYGMNINAVASSITEKVRYIVSEAADTEVSRVRVKIDGIKE